MKRSTVLAAAVFAASTSFLTMTSSGAAQGLRDGLADRIESRGDLRDLLGDRIRAGRTFATS